jgi:hypothetical protein
MSRNAFHEQSWCEWCQEAKYTCSGDHASPPIQTPLTGGGWTTTDTGCEVPGINVFATWCEFEADNPVPSVYVGITSPAEVLTPQGYLDVEMAERLRDSLTAAIDHVKLTLCANHHLICDCGEGNQ